MTRTKENQPVRIPAKARRALHISFFRRGLITKLNDPTLLKDNETIYGIREDYINQRIKDGDLN